MAEHGIGASVARTEDHRFLTGTGDYTDDTNLPRQTHAAFVRSTHSHASFTLDTDAASGAPGVVAVLTGADLAADAEGNGLICGWQVTGKDGEPHKAPAAPGPRGRHRPPRRGRDRDRGRGERPRGARRGRAGGGELLAASRRRVHAATRSRTGRRRSTPMPRGISATTGRSATGRRPTTRSPAPTTWPGSIS